MAIALDQFNLTVSLLSKIKNALDLETTESKFERNTNLQFTDGAGALQIDGHWTDERTIAASGTDDLDLAGVLADAFGATITMARVKVLYIEADSTNTNNVQVGGAAANQFVNWIDTAAAKVNIRPNGMQLLVAPDATGYVVTAGTGDILRISNSGAGTSVKYRIYIGFSLT